MQARRLLVHSIRQVFGNLGMALRISAVLYVIQWVVTLLLDLSMRPWLPLIANDQAAISAAAKGQAPTFAVPKGLSEPGVLALLILVAVVVVPLTDFWIAVAWHRFVLKEEANRGLIPMFDGRRILGYFGTGLAIVGMLIVPALLISLVVGGTLHALLGAGYLPALVTQILSQTLLGAFAFRMSAVLAGVALEPGHRISEAWQATEGETMTFLELAFYCALGLAAADIAGSVLFGGFFILQVIYSLVAQWMITMIGVSILTTLYGHYIQKRPLV